MASFKMWAGVGLGAVVTYHNSNRNSGYEDISGSEANSSISPTP